MRFWPRQVGHWFKGSNPASGSGGVAKVGQTDLSTASFDSKTSGAIPATGETSSGPASGLRRSRSGTTVERLEEEYERMVGLIDAIKQHQESQARDSAQMAGSLDRLAQSLTSVPEVSKNHLELLSSIRDEILADVVCTKRIAEDISQLPQIADAQRETMVSIGRQLDLSRESSEQTAAAMSSFQDLICKLSEATTASAKTLQEMRWDASARDQKLTALLSEQTNRFAFFAWAAIALATVAAAVGLLALFR